MSAKRSRVELFEEIRRARRVDPEVSIHELARRFETHRRRLSPMPLTVRQLIERPCRQNFEAWTWSKDGLNTQYHHDRIRALGHRGIPS